MNAISQIARRQSAEAAPVVSARERALEARNQIIRDAVARLAPSAQAIVIDSYARAFPDDTNR